MGIRKWRHRGRERIVLSKIWPDGTRFRRFMPNRTVARQLETKIDYAVVMGNWRDLKEELQRGRNQRSRENPTIREFADEYLGYCRPRNRDLGFKERNVRQIVRILGDVRVRDFKRYDADRFVDTRLLDRVSPATVNRGLAVLKNMLTLAVERDYRATHPLRSYRMLPEVDPSRSVLHGIPEAS